MSKAYEFLKECSCFYVLTINGDFPAGRPFGAVMEYNSKKGFKEIEFRKDEFIKPHRQWLKQDEKKSDVKSRNRKSVLKKAVTIIFRPNREIMAQRMLNSFGFENMINRIKLMVHLGIISIFESQTIQLKSYY